MKTLIASDHAGERTKKQILKILEKNKYAFEDLSPKNTQTDDYPDYAQKVAQKITPKNQGILICGTGIGMSIAANKHKGIRAALCRSAKDTELARKHNNANILVLSSKTKKVELEKIINAFKETKFEKGRHLRRINKIKQQENKK
ncbi:MAG: ribose 5-phosphate isomerase B [Candidatus Woesearchaeota archaeon]